jgi:hypothetical protein
MSKSRCSHSNRDAIRRSLAAAGIAADRPAPQFATLRDECDHVSRLYAAAMEVHGAREL